MALGIMDGAGHVARGMFRSDLWRWLDLTRNVSAVTGACLAIRRELFEKVGGFDPVFPVNYNDVDLCLRVREAGYEIVCEPGAVLRHSEGQSRAPGTRLWERERFQERWMDRLTLPDPYYSPHFDTSLEEPALRFPPAATPAAWR
jgi:GT2 family glycosyltransferase